MADVITTLHPEGAPEDNLYPNVKDENIPSSIERKGVALWLNANPNSSFGSQTINVSENVNSYSELAFYFKITNDSSKAAQEFKIKTGYDSNAYAGFVSGVDLYSRNFAITSDTTILFGDGVVNSSSNSGICIPVAIYGIK